MEHALRPAMAMIEIACFIGFLFGVVLSFLSSGFSSFFSSFLALGLGRMFGSVLGVRLFALVQIGECLVRRLGCVSVQSLAQIGGAVGASSHRNLHGFWRL